MGQAVSLDVGQEGEDQGALESSLEGVGRADPLFALSLVPVPDLRSSSALAVVLTWAGWKEWVAGSPAAGSASLWISSAQGSVLAAGGMCRAVESRSSAGSQHHILLTLFLSRALTPGLYFSLIDYLCHCRAEILHRESCLIPYHGNMRNDHYPATPIDNSE